MAMQTGVASSKILILVGAGLTGSIILKNGRLPDVLAELQELMKGVNPAEVSSSHYDTSLLASQIRHLAQEVRELTLSRPVTIFNGESASSGGLASYIMPAAAVGAMGYCYMWWKGWSFSDVMFVTKRNMATAVANMSKQLEQVSAALAACSSLIAFFYSQKNSLKHIMISFCFYDNAFNCIQVTKRHITQRLENLDGKLDEQKETSKLIINEVSEVKTNISQIGFDIESIQKMISGLEGKIGLLESKQDMTNTGIYYLCQVAGGIKDGFGMNFFLEASSKLQFNRSSPTFSEVEPLQGLQFLADVLKPGGEEEELKRDDVSQKDFGMKPSKDPPAKATTLHRSYRSGITLRKEGLLL